MSPQRGIELKTEGQLRLMRKAGLVVARAHDAVRRAARPGVTTGELDAVARDVLASAGAGSSFLNYGAGFGLPPYPGVACLSVNNEIVHGIPGERVLVEGDLVSMDFGAIVSGWHGDAAITFGVGEVSAEREALSDATREALWAGIAAARLGGRVGDVSHAVERSIRSHARPYGIVSEYTGHGIGSAMHQAPDVPNFGHGLVQRVGKRGRDRGARRRVDGGHPRRLGRRALGAHDHGDARWRVGADGPGRRRGVVRAPGRPVRAPVRLSRRGAFAVLQ